MQWNAAGERDGAEPAEAARTSRDRPVRRLRVLGFLASGPIGWGLLQFGKSRPDLVESIYVDHVFPLMRGLLSVLFSWWPISAAEGLIAMALGWIGWRALRGLRDARRGQRSLGNLMLHALTQMLMATSVLYALLLLTWGFTNVRQPYAVHAGWEVQADADPAELADLVHDLVARCNVLRPGVSDEDLEVLLDHGRLDPRVVRGFAALAEEVPAVHGGLPVVRVPMAARLLTLFQVGGIYSPFTGEAHVNREPPVWRRAFTTCHEIAHQRGFAREDEANFIAYQVCVRARDAAFEYSGTFHAMQYALGALRRSAPERHTAEIARISERVRDDLRASTEFWMRWKGPISKVAQSTNDRYLRLQGQTAGRASYGRMVDLMLAERRARAAAGASPARTSGD